MSDLMELVNGCEVVKEMSAKIDGALAQASQLKALGFSAMADKLLAEATRKAKLNRVAEFKYVRVTDDKIKEFLRQKVTEYNLSIRKPKKMVYSRDSHWNALYTTGVTSIRSQEQLDNYIRDAQSLRAQMQGVNQTRVIENTVQLRGSYKRAYDRIAVQTDDYAQTEDGTIGKYTWEEDSVAEYQGIPPANVLKTLEEHKARQLFDDFTVATVKAMKDPLLLGRLSGVSDRFYIAQWGDDVSLDDVI